MQHMITDVNRPILIRWAAQLICRLRLELHQVGLQLQLTVPASSLEATAEEGIPSKRQLRRVPSKRQLRRVPSKRQLRRVFPRSDS